jgi:hypothetical protein
MASLFLASLFSYVVYGVLQLPTLPASLIVTGLTSAVSFLILKLWAFRRQPVVLEPTGTESVPANLAV